MATAPSDVTLHEVPVGGGVTLHTAVAGEGPAVLLLHGFPHTWRLWSAVLGPLAERYRVIAPDLRGLGASTRAADGYDADTLAGDAGALLDALGERSAAVVAIDAGVPPAFLLALRRPALVRRLVLMESLLGTLPGAEEFLAGGPPWWFGFHAADGLGESVLTGHEGAYVDWFLDAGTLGEGVPREVRDAFVAAYTGAESLRCAFSYYRAMPRSARQLARATGEGRLTVPVLAVGARPVGDALHRQLRPVADELTGRLIEDCGHIIPLHRPAALLDALLPFLRG
ncbi:alpha/beta fold hydrolase [Streptomyces sp. NPDC050560]|uniref:alpha/beta fold hydrolase n=1 Tax=Streptomyces sp. NPDC050560 TaxID=3365630 RepID=UPI0037B66DC4